MFAWVNIFLVICNLTSNVAGVGTPSIMTMPFKQNWHGVRILGEYVVQTKKAN